LKKWVIRKSAAKRALWPSINLASGRVEVFDETTEPVLRTLSIRL
jgi:hypothetical protein